MQLLVIVSQQGYRGSKLFLGVRMREALCPQKKPLPVTEFFIPSLSIFQDTL